MRTHGYLHIDFHHLYFSSSFISTSAGFDGVVVGWGLFVCLSSLFAVPLDSYRRTEIEQILFKQE